MKKDELDMSYTSEFCKFYNNLKIDVNTEFDVVYHYTSASTLLSIIQRKKNCVLQIDST